MFLNRMSIPISRIIHRQPIAFVLPSLRRHSGTEKKDIFNDFDDFGDVLEILGNHRSSSEHINTGTDGQTKTPPVLSGENTNTGTDGQIKTPPVLPGDTRHPLNRIADIMEKALYDQRNAMYITECTKTEQARSSRVTMEELNTYRNDMLKVSQAVVSEYQKQTVAMDRIVLAINNFKTMFAVQGLCCITLASAMMVFS